ncbi:MAG: ABC transporter ATP-binding protein [Cetobacterium sp.]
MKILEIKNLSIYLKDVELLKNINFEVSVGESIGIVGESGSGKTLLISYMLSLLHDSKWRIKGLIKHKNLKFAFIPQDSKNAFNPLLNIENHFFEIFYKKNSKSEVREKVIEIFKKMYIETPERILKCYPFQLSGGVLQRIAIALAILKEPDILIADEPTTALDLITQNEILYLLNSLKNSKTSILIISHDFKVIEAIAEKVYVMSKGEIIESNSLKNILQNSEKKYTKELLSSIPRFLPKDKKESFYNEKKILDLKNISHFYLEGRKKIEVLKNISFSLDKGSCLGVVGESGSGKSTLARIITGLQDPKDGNIYYRDELMSKKMYKKNRNKIQMVFQNNSDSLNPYKTIYNILSEPLDNLNKGFFFSKINKHKKIEQISKYLKDVQLSCEEIKKYPSQFSGGQKQRLAIARSLLAKPELLVLDEPTSSLDVTTQARILNLLENIKKQNDLTYILISHSLEVVHQLSDAIIIMYRGRIVEKFLNTDSCFFVKHPYSKKLFNLSLKVDMNILPLKSEKINSISGCVYYDRCLERIEICKFKEPELKLLENEHFIACHL